ncbi:MAG: ABC transporter permease, partial [Solirubrobacterales bacterium]|nr:ABC transporter permease [Solirubrobacterales bacterium]
AVGVATIVALLAFTQGLRNTAAGIVHLGGSDLGVFQSNVSDPTASVLPESIVARLQARRYVSRATPLLLLVEAVHREPGAVLFGADPSGFFARQLVIVAGARPTGLPQALVGDRLAAQLHLSPGRRIVLHGRSYRIAGIYHSGIFFEDAGAVLPLEEAQRVSNRLGEVTNVVVDLAPGTHSAHAARAIEREFPGTRVIDTPEQALRLGANSTLISKAIFVIVVIALIVGAIGVTNTMAMAIMERQEELGLLSTVGWTPGRVAALILGEGVAVSTLGAAGGLLVGTIGGDLLVRALGVSTYVSPSITAWGLGRGLLVGIAIGVLGGIYPAWRVTRMKPLQALAGT